MRYQRGALKLKRRFSAEKEIIAYFEHDQAGSSTCTASVGRFAARGSTKKALRF